MEATSLRFRVYVGVIGIMGNVEATSLGFRVYMEFIRIMEKKMETASLGFRAL